MWAPFNTSAGVIYLNASARCKPPRDIFSYASFIQNNIYTSVPGVSGPVENRSCPESTRFFSQSVIPLSWSQFVFDGWIMAEWLRSWLQQWAAWGVSEILEVPRGPRFNTDTHLMIGIYPAVSARGHVLVFPSYKIISKLVSISISMRIINVVIVIVVNWCERN